MGSAVDKYVQLKLVMGWRRFLPFRLVRRDPQLVCLAFQSPPAMNLVPR